MPIATRHADVIWDGSLARGAGSLALVLGEAKTPPQGLAVDCVCTLEEVEGVPRITKSQITVRAEVSGIDEAEFNEALDKAAALCPVSSALSESVSVEVWGQLDRGHG